MKLDKFVKVKKAMDDMVPLVWDASKQAVDVRSACFWIGHSSVRPYRRAVQTTSPRFALQKEQEDEVTQKDYCYSAFE